jgi:predicted kinase
MTCDRASAGRLTIMVGLPASGKTTTAGQMAADRGALRLTPDEWMIPLFGQDFRDDAYERRRDVLEGRLISVAIDVLRAGVDVVLDFGCWSRAERNGLRHLAAAVGAECEIFYLTASEEEQSRRVRERWEHAPHTTFLITDEDLARWAVLFEAPDARELEGGPLDSPPDSYGDWGEWARRRWPSLTI